MKCSAHSVEEDHRWEQRFAAHSGLVALWFVLYQVFHNHKKREQSRLSMRRHALTPSGIAEGIPVCERSFEKATKLAVKKIKMNLLCLS